MRRSSMLGSFRQSRLAAAALIAATAAVTAGCSKDQPPGSGSEAPVKEPQQAQEQAKATPEGAARPADQPSQAAPPTGADEGKEAQGGTQAKADPNKPSPSRVAGQPETQAPAAAPPGDPAAPAPAAAGDPAAPAPTSAAGDGRTAEVTSPKVGESNFSVWMQSAGKHKVGQQGVVEVVLVPKNGFKCNDAYPYKIKLSDPPAGVTFPQPVVRKESMSVSPQRGVMRVPFVPTAAGDQRIAGKFSFSVCTSDQCLIDSRDLAITVKVE